MYHKVILPSIEIDGSAHFEYVGVTERGIIYKTVHQKEDIFLLISNDDRKELLEVSYSLDKLL